MAPPNKVLKPDNLDRELGDLRRKIRALETQGSTSLPGTYSESIDAAHAMDIDFPLSSGIKATLAKLSFKLKPYRSTSSFAGGATGVDSNGHSHSHTHGSHAHTIPIIQNAVATAALFWDQGGTNQIQSGNVTGNSTPINSTTPTADASGESTTHTHTVGASSLGVAEGSMTTIAALAIDGVDKTTLLGGPWGTDIVDLDLLSVIPVGDGAWHKITLTPAGQGRIVAILKLS